MSWREFTVQLVRAVAWPASIAVVVLTLRRQLKALLENRLQSLKLGPGGLELVMAARAEAEQIRAEAAQAAGALEAAADDEALPAPVDEFVESQRVRAWAEFERLWRALPGEYNAFLVRQGRPPLLSSSFPSALLTRELVSDSEYNHLQTVLERGLTGRPRLTIAELEQALRIVRHLTANLAFDARF